MPEGILHDAVIIIIPHEGIAPHKQADKDKGADEIKQALILLAVTELILISLSIVQKKSSFF